jgi:hypothetical protein
VEDGEVGWLEGQRFGWASAFSFWMVTDKWGGGCGRLWVLTADSSPIRLRSDCEMTNKRTGNGKGKNNRRSFDCGGKGAAFAQEDMFLLVLRFYPVLSFTSAQFYPVLGFFLLLRMTWFCWFLRAGQRSFLVGVGLIA